MFCNIWRFYEIGGLLVFFFVRRARCWSGIIFVISQKRITCVLIFAKKS